MDLQSQLDEANREIERLKDIIREQDDARGTTTLRVGWTVFDGKPFTILTCPSQDEREVAGSTATLLAMTMTGLVAHFMNIASNGDNAKQTMWAEQWRKFLGGA